MSLCRLRCCRILSCLFFRCLGPSCLLLALTPNPVLARFAPPPSCYSNTSEIAGVPNVARASQPDMFSILSWVGEAPRAAPDAAAPSPWPTRVAKKEKVANRWVRETRLGEILG